MSAFKNALRLVAIANTRQFSRTATKQAEVAEGYKKIKLIQAQFQKPDGLPVHLKGGTTDKVLLGATTALCLVALGSIVKLIYELSCPPKPDN